jgi:DNA-binding transcriptional ArsR family regulator
MIATLTIVPQRHFVYNRNMNVEQLHEIAVSKIAAAIGEPARARILFCLMDGHARTSTELAAVADVATSTASAHLNRLKAERLVKLVTQGKHRFYSLSGPKVARVLEGLSVLVDTPRKQFVPNTPTRLRAARVCYDHMAGALGVRLHDRFKELGWLTRDADGRDDAYDLTESGSHGFAALNIDVEETRQLRRRFAYACLDWSERRPHLAGAMGAALCAHCFDTGWVRRIEGTRAVAITPRGQRAFRELFGAPFAIGVP